MGANLIFIVRKGNQWLVESKSVVSPMSLSPRSSSSSPSPPPSPLLFDSPPRHVIDLCTPSPSPLRRRRLTQSYSDLYSPLHSSLTPELKRGKLLSSMESSSCEQGAWSCILFISSPSPHPTSLLFKLETRKKRRSRKERGKNILEFGRAFVLEFFLFSSFPSLFWFSLSHYLPLPPLSFLSNSFVLPTSCAHLVS